MVGTKKDLESDRAVSEKERQAKARAWNCQTYEVSSKTNAGVAEVFEKMVQAVLAMSSDPAKGGSGGSVLGAGKSAAAGDGSMTFKKKACKLL